MPMSWDLSSVNRCLDLCSDLSPLGLRRFEQQIEIHSNEETCVIVEEIPDQDPETGADNKAELISDPFLDDRFRRDLHTLRMFAIDYKDIDAARCVLRCLMKEVTSTGDISWIDTPEGISARDFLAKTDQDPQWDWRESKPSNEE
jgi:hypothetical protein